MLKEVIGRTSPSSIASLVRQENLFFIVMNNEDNRMNTKFASEVHKCLDQIEKSSIEEKSKSAVMTLSANPKIFSNGLDIGKFGSSKDVALTFHDLCHLFA